MLKQILNQILGRWEDEHSIAYSRIIDKIIESLENNLEEWEVTWRTWSHRGKLPRLEELYHPNGLFLWVLGDSLTIKWREHNYEIKSLDCKNKKRESNWLK